jgi:hypothetical protein
LALALDEMEERPMKLGPNWGRGLVLILVSGMLAGACGRRQPAEIHAISPAFEANRPRAPLGSFIEVTYTWNVEPTAKKLGKDYRAMAHFLDSQKVILFGDDHVPTPPPSEWEPGKSYSYVRTIFVPIYPYVGDVQVVMGLYSGRERLALKGEDQGLRAYKVADMEFLPQTENIFLVYKEGWHNPESSPENPSLERTWTEKEALVSFKNPKQDIVVYLEADTNFKAFPEPPVLTVSVSEDVGLEIPIESSEVFLKRIRFKGEDLGDEDWVDLRLSMNQSFVPKDLGLNQDERELGLLVYKQLYVAEAADLGLSDDAVVDAGPLAAAADATE